MPEVLPGVGVVSWRRYPSRRGWSFPATPGWLGYTMALRAGVVVVIVCAVFR